MNKKFYNIYQYIAFLIIFPLVVLLWQKILVDIKYVILVLSLPIITAYIVPAIGTNITKLWSFNTKYKVGNFRIYHGFVLGSVTSLFGVMFYKISPNYVGVLDSLIFAFVCGSFIAFWNWFYDIYAVKCGFIVVNNKLAYEGKSAHEVVTDYAPIYFYAFGFVYALYLKMLEYFIMYPNKFSYFLIVIAHIVSLVIPTTIYMLVSYKNHKTWGICKYSEENK